MSQNCNKVRENDLRLLWVPVLFTAGIEHKNVQEMEITMAGYCGLVIP